MIEKLTPEQRRANRMKKFDQPLFPVWMIIVAGVAGALSLTLFGVIIWAIVTVVNKL